MPSDDKEEPAKACHNCRRRRLRCDRSRPHCRKCLAAGKECLGYCKLFRWTGAVASRGKLAGCTSSAPVVDSPVPPPKRDVNDKAMVKRPANADTDAGDVVYAHAHQLVSRSPWSPAGTVSAAARSSLSWVLSDPLYQVLEPSHHYYMSYFTQRLCKDLVSHDVPQHNPFRRLLSLTSAHPLLRYTIVAASAVHLSSLLRTLLSFSGERDRNALSAGAQVGLASRRAHQDALKAKHRALTLMREAVEDLDSATGDVVLAAALLLVNIELIEPGRHQWKAHLEGAGKIMSLLRPVVAENEPLRDYVLSDFFIYFIRSSAFMPTMAFEIDSLFSPAEIQGVLGRAAVNSYLCCPPEILMILHQVSMLLARAKSQALSQDEVTTAGMALLQRAQQVDAGAWARDVGNIPHLQDKSIQSGIHAASAHQLTTCLYVLRAIPSLSTMNGYKNTIESLVGQIFQHLSSMPEDDPNLKAVTWPVFVVGAETTNRAKREWIINRLQISLLSCPWGFLYTTMDTLRALWNMELKGQASTDNWVQVLKNDNMYSLLV